MKKIILFLCSALLTYNVATAEELMVANPMGQPETFTLEAIQKELPLAMTTPTKKVAPQKISRKAALSTAANVAYMYKATANVKSGEKTTQEEWTITTGIDPDYNLPIIIGLLPKGPFLQAQSFDYEVTDNQLVAPAKLITDYAPQTNLPIAIFALDMTDLANKGTGAIVLDLAEDGTLSIPQANKRHDFGYAICQYDEQYAPTKVLETLCTVTAMTYRALAEPATTVNITAGNAGLGLDILSSGVFTVDASATNAEIYLRFKSGAIFGQFSEKQIDGDASYITYKEDKYAIDPERSALSSFIDGYFIKMEGTAVGMCEGKADVSFNLTISAPYTEEWSEWQAFAPKGVSTGKWTYNAINGMTFPNMEVKERTAKSGLKQYQISEFGKNMFGTGVDLVIEVNGQNQCTIAKTQVGNVSISSSAKAPLYITDYDTYAQANTDASMFDQEKGEFSIYAIYTYEYNKQTYMRGAGTETFVMDQKYDTRDSVDVVANTMIINDLIETNQLAIAYCTPESYVLFRVGLDTETDYFGTFKWSEGGINFLNSYFVGQDSVKVYFQDGEVTVSEEQDSVFVTGYVVANDEKAYKLQWSGVKGALINDETKPFNANFAWTNMVTSVSKGVATIQAQNTQNQSIALRLFVPEEVTTIPEGTYEFTDTKAVGTALASTGLTTSAQGTGITYSYAGLKNNAGSITNVWFITSGSVTIGYDEDQKIIVTLNGKNSWKQDVTTTIKYEKLDPKGTATITSTDLFVDQTSLAQYGYTIFTAASSDASVTLIAETTKEVAGEFDYANTMFISSSLVVNKKTLGIIDGSFIVTVQDKNVTLKGTVMGSDTVNYELNLTGVLGALQYDTKDKDFTADFAYGEWQAQANQGIIMLVGQNAKNQIVYMYILTSPVDGKIPAGEYPINNSEYENTVFASPGLSGSQAIPSYAGVTNGQALTDLWFMEEGMVKIDENMNITVEALNSYGKSINITIKSPVSDLKIFQSAQKAVKVLRNGHLEINRNNRRFNILGNTL